MKVAVPTGYAVLFYNTLVRVAPLVVVDVCVVEGWCSRRVADVELKLTGLVDLWQCAMSSRVARWIRIHSTAAAR